MGRPTFHSLPRYRNIATLRRGPAVDDSSWTTCLVVYKALQQGISARARRTWSERTGTHQGSRVAGQQGS